PPARDRRRSRRRRRGGLSSGEQPETQPARALAAASPRARGSGADWLGQVAAARCHRATRVVMKAELITDRAELAAFAPEWDELACAACLPMMAPALVEAWWRTLAPATAA